VARKTNLFNSRACSDVALGAAQGKEEMEGCVKHAVHKWRENVAHTAAP
jgi:hypothetical protein